MCRPPEAVPAGRCSTPPLLERLRGLADADAYLMPMGNSVQEELIGKLTGLRSAVSDAATYERVNSKLYNRRVAEELGLRTVACPWCETVRQLRHALAAGLRDGGPVIVEDAYGVSGKGLVVLDSRKKGDRLLLVIDRRAATSGEQALHAVVEAFLPKRFDLNDQFTIGRDGRVRLDFIKALTSGGVHLGHVMPANLTPAQREEPAEAARKPGARLYADGFFGIVGVDVLLGSDDLVYPVLEINARLNMSSYQGRVTERFGRPEGAALAKHYPLRLSRPTFFDEVTDALGPPAEPPLGRDGLVVTRFGTVNTRAGRAPDGPVEPFESPALHPALHRRPCGAGRVGRARRIPTSASACISPRSARTPRSPRWSS